ncbi:hypothetical protein I2W78_33565 [Streptomyces spinoverrucosus]|uniref:hypothetical protein n=1 Tax=Streptomyces spinoverrucosus TaxID=284043 RepID=UPI0018C36108|nr:hypothetical protein [Streptomyces spinoverrucosus]MBG0856660.1 hypothetical protein [Streptomyces spinoverrucosus]
MSRALPKYHKRRIAMIGGASAVVLSGAVIAGSALAGETSKNNAAQASTKAAAGTISCPAVAPSLPAVPASAKAEVDRNLALLNTQIAEADKRLRETVGQGGPNFVQNAILGPLKDKRVATINRIATAIGRTAARPQGLDSLATCTLGAAGATNNAGGATNNAGGAAGNAGAATPSAPASQGGGGNTGAGTISCPDVASRLPAVPASAKAEVDRNLALLNTQIAEADKRLRETVGQGGPNFVQNAILGPLASKRTAAIDRIAISIGRTAAKPQGLNSLAACTLTK